MSNKKALIFGITGQDGYYLSLYLNNKGYLIFGTSRNKEKIKKQNFTFKVNFYIVNILNYYEVEEVVKKINPDEIYFLSGQSSVSKSSLIPRETINDNFISLLNVIESVKNFNSKIKIFNAGSVECFGNISNKINLDSKMSPSNSYGYSKMITYELVKFYRDNYNLFACTGILSIHESILRPNTFVLKKIITEIQKIKNKESSSLLIGNINIIRDWGWAEEFVEAFYLMLQQNKPEDFIIGTGISVSLKNIIDYTFSKFSLSSNDYVRIDKNFIRKNENLKIELDVSDIYYKLGWKAKKNAFNIMDEYFNNLNK